MQTKTLFEILAGLGIFLLGLKFMSNGLQDFAGKKIKSWIEKATKTNIHAVLLGIIVTGLLQSSSGSTALTVALVAGGMMTFKQAAGVVLGANIGTTITAFLIGVKISAFAPLIIAIGAFMYMFGKREKITHFATALLGFGFIFFGLSQMGSPLKSLSSEPWFADVVSSMSSNSVLAFFSGSALTALVQSSSAFIGITQEMYAQAIIPLTVAIPFVLGANIGTTVTAIIASWGSGQAAKRTALFHLLINFVFGLAILIVIVPYSGLMEWITNNFGLNAETELAVTHGIFNVMMAIITLPFLTYIVKFVEKVIKSEEVELGPIDINEELLSSTNATLALYSLQQAISKMTDISVKCVQSTSEYIKTQNKTHIETAKQLETATDSLRTKLHKYLRKIDTQTISKKNAKVSQWLTMSVKDIERVGDISLDICKLQSMIEGSKKINLSDNAVKELNTLSDLVIKLGKLSTEYLVHPTIELYKEATKIEEKIDEATLKFKKAHYKRKADKKCSVAEIFDYTSMLSSYERAGDHFYNIFKSFKAGPKPTKKK